MAGICNCDAGFNNTGTPSCLFAPDLASRIFIVPKFGSNGSLNSIGVADTINEQYISDKIHASDWRDRWFPITQSFNRVEDTKGDNVTSDFDGTSVVVRKGDRTWTGVNKDAANPAYAGYLDEAGCIEAGVYILDLAGNLQGVENDDSTKLYPLYYQKSTWSVKFLPATASEVPLLELTFTFDRNIDEKKLSYIKASEVDDTISTINGLINVTVSEVVAPTTTGLTVDLNYIYGGFGTKSAYKGATLAMLTLENITVGDEVTMDSVTETTDGRYLIDYTGDAQSAGNVLRLVSKVTTGIIQTTGHEIIDKDLTAIA